jgi:two-component system phosphate regulon sensor histidine kinase PhoR
MPPFTQPDSLLRRLVDQHLVVGLGCVFLCIAFSLSMTWHGIFTDHVAVAVLGPLLLLLIGGFFLRRSVTVHTDIEEQLKTLAAPEAAAEAILRPIYDPDPAAAGWNSLVEQIQDRRVLSGLEERLNHAIGKADQGELSLVLAALTDGVAVSNSEGEMTLANGALASLLGAASPDDLLGVNIVDCLANELAPAAQPFRELLLGHAGPGQWETRTGTGQETGVYRIQRRPLDDAGSTLWLVRDITQQKLAEEARDEFLVTATHELRTPLANLKAYAETLAVYEGIDVEQQKTFCNIINSEATRLARFVDDLLDVSQMEAGAVRLARHEVDLARLLEETIAHVRPQADQKQLNFETRLPPKLPHVIADKDKLSAALVNLLGNGIKYTPEGGSVFFRVEADDKQVHFHVEDTGIGISAEDLPNMFRKFYRSADARVQAETGSGLGLAFTYEVARLHGGGLTVESTLNRGSHFTLTLPIAREGG